jgi:hypothetical protein
MINSVSRRNFLKTTFVSVGAVFAYSIAGTRLLANSVKQVLFSTNKGRGGCDKCEKAIAKMLNDKAKKQELEKLFAGKGMVTFYVRNQKRRKLSSGVNIAVGHCARKITRESSCFIDGCKKEINSTLIFNEIKKHLKAN